MTVSAESSSVVRSQVDVLFRPANIAIIGASSKPGALSNAVLRNLRRSNYEGEILLVGRSGGEVDGIPILTHIEELPVQVDLGILVVPAEALLTTVEQCVAREMRTAICFASGFAEMGNDGRQQQSRIGQIARQGNLALVGPNTIGYSNFIDGFHVRLIEQIMPPPLPDDGSTGMAIVTQSGGIAAHLASSLQARKVPTSYVMATGNEADQEVTDMIDFLADDPRTSLVAIYAEEIKSPPKFLTAARRAIARGKTIVLLHPGRSEKGRAAASSHTGALAADHSAMRTTVSRAGVLVVDTLEELIDVAELAYRYPKPLAGGLGLVTASGAICALVQDYAETLSLNLPDLGEEQVEALRDILPVFLPPRNPLDLGTLLTWQPQLVGLGVKALLSDPNIGAVIVSLPLADTEYNLAWLNSYLELAAGHPKPVIYVVGCEDAPLDPALQTVFEDNGIVLKRSAERALRTIAKLRSIKPGPGGVPTGETRAPLSFDLGTIGSGPLPEWKGKRLLSEVGVPVPRGSLATTVEQAADIATAIGYPVVLKAQAKDLQHKTEVGGVVLKIADAEGVKAAWTTLQNNIRKNCPEIALDGILVEEMSQPGLEMVVGSIRDPKWGPVVMIGLGGIWIEALGDIRLIPPDLSKQEIVEEIWKLRGAKLLSGFRGAPAIDVEAVADVVAAIGQLMLAETRISEVDVNPLVARPQGQGAIALDALIVA